MENFRGSTVIMLFSHHRDAVLFTELVFEAMREQYKVRR